MIHILLSLTVVAPEAPYWLPSTLRDSEKYDLLSSRRSGGEQSVTLRRASDSVQIRIACFGSSEEKSRSPEVFSAYETSRVYGTRDGFPFSRQYVRDATSLTAFSRSLDFREFIITSLTGKHHQEGSHRWTEEQPFHLDAPEIEAWNRQAFAGYATRRLGAMDSRSVGGVSVKSWPATDGRVIDLSDLAAKAGFAVNESDDHSRVSFTIQGTTFIAPLGARKIKRGNAWIDLPEVIMLKSGHVLVPIEAFTGG